MNDIGILASTDPVAIDEACIDLVKNSNDPGKEKLLERLFNKAYEKALAKTSLIIYNDIIQKK